MTAEPSSEWPFNRVLDRALRTNRGKDWNAVYAHVEDYGLDTEEKTLVFDTLQGLKIKDAQGVKHLARGMHCLVHVLARLRWMKEINPGGKRYPEVRMLLLSFKGHPKIDEYGWIESIRDDWPEPTADDA